MRRRAGLVAIGAGVALLVAGCDSPQNTLRPHSEATREITSLWWWMLLAGTIVFLGTVGLMGLAFVRRRSSGLPLLGEREDVNWTLVLLFGVGVPFVALIAVFTVANFAVAAKTDAQPRGSEDLTIQVVGRQWWWEVRYPGSGAVTANEIHIPVRSHVNVEVSTADVIHSFWVPQLNRKIDLIPGRHNRVELYADRPGRYVGQCAEYCGVQHAHMRMVVIAEPADRYRAWLAATAAPARAPSSPEAQRGKRAFEANACASCHQIRGTPAGGRVGPDLTHLGERSSLAALTIPNTPAELSHWIRDPQHVKPGNRMPGLNLPDQDFDAIATYLEGLR